MSFENDPIKFHDQRPGRFNLRGQQKPDAIIALKVAAAQRWADFDYSVDKFGATDIVTKNARAKWEQAEKDLAAANAAFAADPESFWRAEEQAEAEDYAAMCADLRRGG